VHGEGVPRGVEPHKVDPFEKQTLKPGYHISGSRVETWRRRSSRALYKGATPRLSQLSSARYGSTTEFSLCAAPAVLLTKGNLTAHGAFFPAVYFGLFLGISFRAVALQVAFERQTLKPVFHLIGYRLWV
jgi:hypothetical protein